MAAATPDQFLSFFFRPTGRISRLEFVLGAGLVMCLDLALLSYLLRDGIAPPANMFFVAFVGLPLTIAVLVIAAKRCHDVGLPGSFVLLLVIPVVGLAWLVLLGLLPGKAGPNAYGPAPQFTPE